MSSSSYRTVVFIKAISAGGDFYNDMMVGVKGVDWLWSIDGGVRANVRGRIFFIPWSNVTFAEEE